MFLPTSFGNCWCLAIVAKFYILFYYLEVTYYWFSWRLLCNSSGTWTPVSSRENYIFKLDDHHSLHFQCIFLHIYTLKCKILLHALKFYLTVIMLHIFRYLHHYSTLCFRGLLSSICIEPHNWFLALCRIFM